jgi:hypothetical protein
VILRCTHAADVKPSAHCGSGFLVPCGGVGLWFILLSGKETARRNRTTTLDTPLPPIPSVGTPESFVPSSSQTVLVDPGLYILWAVVIFLSLWTRYLLILLWCSCRSEASNPSYFVCTGDTKFQPQSRFLVDFASKNIEDRYVGLIIPEIRLPCPWGLSALATSDEP